MTEKNTEKRSIFIPFFLYIFITTIFITLDFSFKENLNVFFNILFLFGATAIFVSIFRFMFETVLIKIADYFFEKKLDIQTIVHSQSNSLYIPSFIVAIFIIIQLVFIRDSAPFYQAIVLIFVQIMYMIIFMRKINRDGKYVKLNSVLFLYMLLYFTFQMLTLP